VQHFHLDPMSAGDGGAVLRVGGEIDVYTAPKLREAVIELVDRRASHIIADLREVEFLDSTGLGALIGAQNRLRTRDGSLRLVITSERIMRIFRITGLVKVFEIHATVLEAITRDDRWQRIVEAEGNDIESWCRQHGLL
jgi:anti-sigma B factor antagonist